MCCCGKPTINGEPGYSWDGKTRGVHPPNAPAVSDGQTILYDEPGRCGGLDSHSYHYRIVKERFGMSLLVRHGGGDERIGITAGDKTIAAPLAALDSDGRYWMLNTIYHAHRYAERKGRDTERDYWRKAAAQKRIKTRKLPKRGEVKVWIEPERIEQEAP